jgi:hypothetical protein
MSSYPYFPEERQEFPVLGVVSAWLGFVAVIATAVSRITTTDQTRVWANPILSVVTVSVIALTLASIIYARYSGLFNLKMAAIPLFINLSTLLIVHLVPFAELWQDLRFQWRWSHYDEVTDLVETGRIQPDATGWAQLPTQYAYLSENGRVKVSRHNNATHIFFTVHSTKSQHISGYLYASDNQLPTSAEWQAGWQYVVQKRPNWFWCTVP